MRIVAIPEDGHKKVKSWYSSSFEFKQNYIYNIHWSLLQISCRDFFTCKNMDVHSYNKCKSLHSYICYINIWYILYIFWFHCLQILRRLGVRGEDWGANLYFQNRGNKSLPRNRYKDSTLCDAACILERYKLFNTILKELCQIRVMSNFDFLDPGR